MGYRTFCRPFTRDIYSTLMLDTATQSRLNSLQETSPPFGWKNVPPFRRPVRDIPGQSLLQYAESLVHLPFCILEPNVVAPMDIPVSLAPGEMRSTCFLATQFAVVGLFGSCTGTTEREHDVPSGASAQKDPDFNQGPIGNSFSSLCSATLNHSSENMAFTFSTIVVNKVLTTSIPSWFRVQIQYATSNWKIVFPIRLKKLPGNTLAAPINSAWIGSLAPFSCIWLNWVWN